MEHLGAPRPQVIDLTPVRPHGAAEGTSKDVLLVARSSPGMLRAAREDYLRTAGVLVASPHRLLPITKRWDSSHTRLRDFVRKEPPSKEPEQWQSPLAWLRQSPGR